MFQTKNILGCAIIAALLYIPASASAFCGFYVGGAGAEMFADATQVVLLRDGTKTVLSMQNRYDGPVDDFALVVPIPEIVTEASVKTLDPEIFTKIDTLGSPRLVEYWEQDPCNSFRAEADVFAAGGATNADDKLDPGEVVVEAQFTVGEYEIVVLSTNESTALENWLTDNDFNIPAGADQYLEPYIQNGMYFFAAKVDSSKVTFNSEGQAVLSPLRFHYDTPNFELPVRLGMINSNGQQDLLVHILADNQRYDVENYPNITIPTNIEVVDSVRNDFGGFYRALFARTIKENPGAAVTEYSWAASGCDPCPGPVTLTPEDVATLGADVIGEVGDQGQFRNWVLTRLHMRYDKDEVGEDLVFKKADAIVGGREFLNENGTLEEGALPSDWNAFQARYIIRHRWSGQLACADPIFETWGGNPEDGGGSPTVTPAASPNTTGDSVFSAGDQDVEDLVTEDIPELDVIARGNTKSSAGGCSASTVKRSLPVALFALFGIAIGWRRRKRDNA